MTNNTLIYFLNVFEILFSLNNVITCNIKLNIIIDVNGIA